MVLSTMRVYIKYIYLALISVLICNLVFVLIYGISAFMPNDSVIKSLQSSQQTGVLKTPINSIERSTTGLGLDYGTECAAIAISLKTKPEYNQVNKFFSRFYDGYLVSGANTGVFDPCSGLVEIISASNDGSEESQLSSYARNWWGMSIIIQVGILLFGLAMTKSYLFILMISALSIFYCELSRYSKDWKIGIFLLSPLILFGDFQELHNSFPYSLFTIQLFFTGWIVIRLIGGDRYSSSAFLIISIAFGSIYNFIFWYNFHLVLTLIPITIYLMHFRIKPLREIYKKISIFVIGYIFGFLATTLIKWFISVLLFGDEIWVSIKNALSLRLSSGSSGLNQALSDYSSPISFLPLPLRAVVINCMAFASKFSDPRNASLMGILIGFTLILVLVYFYRKKVVVYSTVSKREFFNTLPVLCIPLFYYLLTPNHSFNHAVLSYRAIPISLGFILSFIYLGKTRKIN